MKQSFWERERERIVEHRPCRPLLLPELFQELLAHRWASNLFVHLCLFHTLINPTYPRKRRMKQEVSRGRERERLGDSSVNGAPPARVVDVTVWRLVSVSSSSGAVPHRFLLQSIIRIRPRRRSRRRGRWSRRPFHWGSVFFSVSNFTQRERERNYSWKRRMGSLNFAPLQMDFLTRMQLIWSCLPNWGDKTKNSGEEDRGWPLKKKTIVIIIRRKKQMRNKDNLEPNSECITLGLRLTKVWRWG